LADVRVSLRVTGLVQGVFYRANTAQVAGALGLSGWVRNEDDGAVAAVIEGPRAKVDELVAWCHRGPARARVESVEASYGPATGEFSGFAVRT
jgi:acylphosphatase